MGEQSALDAGVTSIKRGRNMIHDERIVLVRRKVKKSRVSAPWMVEKCADATLVFSGFSRGKE